ncbi:hypothetical protein APR41_07975 [Salegentibacter salinarum]|uniref:N-acetyltransferase domain-containing protein n=2 Tax=Salegentibacter salinarum TaxID=447422 RepID=A0A2N0TPR4_9FLAO|nr:hypothetical protein APR41_07975 [Salegentibacter salinarum]
MGNYEILKWDSDFFGFKVAKIEEQVFKNKTTDPEDFFWHLKQENVHLIYCYSSKPIDVLKFNKHYSFDHIVTRIPLIMKLNRKFDFHPKISFYNEDNVNESLKELAVLAGLKGRFGKDKKIPKSSCEGVFKSWIENSLLNKEPVLIYKIDNEIVGMITFKIEGESGFGGLLAVYPEFEGKGISFALLRAMMYVLQERGCNFFYSGTQQLNTKALKVFERFGLIPQEPQFVYHLWKKN